MVILYEGNRRGLFYKKRSRRGKIRSVLKLSGKRTITGQNSGKFLLFKNTEGAISYKLGISSRYKKQSRVISYFVGRISQVKRQSKKSY